MCLGTYYHYENFSDSERVSFQDFDRLFIPLKFDVDHTGVSIVRNTRGREKITGTLSRITYSLESLYYFLIWDIAGNGGIITT